MTSTIRTRRLVISTVSLSLAGIAVAAAMLTSGPAAPTTSGSSASATMSADMPGMDHGFGNAPAPSPTMSADSPWKTHDDSNGAPHTHGISTETAPDRPLAPVLGTFGGGTSAVLLSAGFLRHRDRDRSRAKAAARAAHGSLK